MTDKDSKSDESNQGVLSSEGIRVGISLVLIFHLTSLFLVVTSNMWSNGDPSNLRNKVTSKILRPYAQALNINRTYGYYLTYHEPFDYAHYFEIEKNYKRDQANQSQSEVIQWPKQEVIDSEGHEQKIAFTDKVKNAIRNPRIRALIKTAAYYIEDEEVESILPRAIAKYLLDVHEVATGQHRIYLQWRHPAIQDEYQNNQNSLQLQYAKNKINTLYQADLSFYKDELILTKAEEKARTSLVIDPQEKDEALNKNPPLIKTP